MEAKALTIEILKKMFTTVVTGRTSSGEADRSLSREDRRSFEVRSDYSIDLKNSNENTSNVNVSSTKKDRLRKFKESGSSEDHSLNSEADGPHSEAYDTLAPEKRGLYSPFKQSLRRARSLSSDIKEKF